MIKTTDKLAAARLRACKLAPYFRSGILALIARITDEIDTLAVTATGGIMLASPKHVDATPLDTLAADIIHEYCHVFLKHAARFKAIGAEDHDLANLAGDASIEDMIAGLPRHSWVVTPASLKLPSGLTAEGYYRALLKRKQDEQKQQKQDEQKQQKQDEQKQQKQDQKSEPSEQGKGEQGKGEQGKGEQGKGEQNNNNNNKKTHKCGGCAGNAHAIEAKIIAEESGGRSSSEITRAIKQTAEAIKREAAKGTGTIAGSLVALADQVLAPPRVNWRAKLTQLVRDSVTYKTGAVTQRYTKPSRRQAGLGYGSGRATLAALVAPVPRIAVAVDTSGSMGTEEITKALSEIQGVLKAVSAPIDFVAFDTKAGKLVKINNILDARRNLTGRGGTDFRPVMAQLSNAKPAYDAVIVITDGGGQAPDLAPRFKTIWALVGSYKTSPYGTGGQPIAWGEVVNVD